MKRIGTIGLIPALVKQEARIARHSAVLRDPGGTESAYMARALVLCTLPYRDPGDVPVWSRKSGSVTLGIQPGYDLSTKESLGYPYGVIPRLVLFWLITRLVHVKDRVDLTLDQKRHVELGSLPVFMRALGMEPQGGGARSDRRRLEEQVRRLFRARISFQETRRKGGEAWLNMEVTTKGELWWDSEHRGQPSLFPSWVSVGEDFYQAATAVPVPVDMRALVALKRSPLALDLYALLSFVAYIANQKDSPQLVKWRALAEQLGGSYRDVKDFKKATQAELAKIVGGGFLDVALLPVHGGFKVLPGGVPAVAPGFPQAR